MLCNYSVAPEYWGKGSNFILKHFLFFQDYLKSLHDLHEDWLVKRTKFSLPSKVLVGKIYLIHFTESISVVLKISDSLSKTVSLGTFLATYHYS